VSFDGAARLQVSPTVDRLVVHRAIDNLTLHEGTAIGEAIFTSLDAIAQLATPEEQTQEGQPAEPIPARIVLMSDGKTTVGRSNDEAAQAAVEASVPVSTIAFGTDEGTIEIPQEVGPVPVPVDREALKEIADQTDGSFFEAATAEQLENVYANIGSSIGYETKQQEITAWFVGLGLIALIVTAALSLTWFNRMV
jgi:Ca-activated chloride channel family protein